MQKFLYEMTGPEKIGLQRGSAEQVSTSFDFKQLEDDRDWRAWDQRPSGSGLDITL